MLLNRKKLRFCATNLNKLRLIIVKGVDEMDNRSIIALYWERDESAIAKTAEKYGKYLYTVSKNIVSVHEDAEECVQDTYKTDNHGSVHLRDTDGNVINCAVNIAFWDKNKIGGYEEYIFDIPQENVDDYKVFADMVLCSNLTEGPWQVTFPLEKK